MTKRSPTIRLQPDWKAGLRPVGRKTRSTIYQGKELAFETPPAFFSRLTMRRWELVRMMQGKGALSMRTTAGDADRLLSTERTSAS